MNETGVLFKPAMSAALRRDVNPKTQTRRPLKVQPIGTPFAGQASLNRSMTRPVFYAMWETRAADGSTCCICPYGVPGDRLWARETFFAFGRWVTRFSEEKGRDEWCFVDMTLETGRAYLFDEPAGWVRRQRAAGGATPGWWKRPSIHMPRVASRITLEVTGVRVERLQEISEADAKAEGAPDYEEGVDAPPPDGDHVWSYRASYRRLWESINGPGSWDANPFVWVVEFRRV